MTLPLLNPAFSIEWPTNSQETAEKIFELLEKVCSPLRASSKQGKRERKKRRRLEKNPVGKSNETEKGNVEEEILPLASTSACSKQSWNSFKDSTVIGISSVLRHLETNSLSVVLFDGQLLQPSAISQFIGSACIASGAHCVCLDDLSDRIAPILKIKSAGVIAIKKLDKYSESIGELVNYTMNTTKAVHYCSQGVGGENKKQRRKRTLKETTVADQKLTTVSFVEPTVTVCNRKKRKRKD